MRRVLLTAAAYGAALLAVGGCGRQSDGPVRYDVSGTVSYDGQPVPAGFITFAPDDAQGNSGPGGGAPINAGHYRTPAGKGVVGGPHLIRIVGYDGVAVNVEGESLPDGKPLFPPFETTVDFPKESIVHDFQIPRQEPASSAGTR
jgi:hypothetical protein